MNWKSVPTARVVLLPETLLAGEKLVEPGIDVGPKTLKKKAIGYRRSLAG
jgi:hypothetical protein